MSEDKQTIAQVLWIGEMEIKAFVDALLVATLSNSAEVRQWAEKHLHTYAEMKQSQYAARGIAQPFEGVSAEGAAWAADYNPMVNVGNDMWKNDPPYPQCTCRVIDGKHDPHCPGSPEYWQKRQS